MTEHTPTPWEVHELNHIDDDLWLTIGHAGRGPIADIPGRLYAGDEDGVAAEIKYLAVPDEVQRANADLIVQRVNAYDDLLAALHMIVDNAELWPDPRLGGAADIYIVALPTNYIKAARAAIAKAEAPGDSGPAQRKEG